MGGRRAVRRLVNESPETAVVQDMTAEGRGVVHVAGKRVFVAGAIRGERVTFRRVRSRRNYDEADLIEVHDPAPERVEPRCGYFGTCGGCSLQHLSQRSQLALKEAVLVENLRRIGFVTADRLVPPVSGPPWAYRRRARLAVRFVSGKGRVLVGFSERDSSHITDMWSCETVHPAVSALIRPLSELIGGLTLAQRIPQVEVAVADNATALVLRVLDEPSSEDLNRLRAFGDRHGVRLLLQRAGPDAIVPLDAGTDGGELWYELRDEGLRLTFGPTDFVQVNAAVNERMVALALALLQPREDDRVLDLFCGIGNFTLPLARRAAMVVGIEGVAAMVARADHNARCNHIGNVSFRVADLAAGEVALAWSGQHFDAVLLDPPRAGAAALMRPLAATGARRIVYVSCHPGSLARDAGVLVNEHGYRLSAAGILDMFPATAHVESIAVFERRGA
jgi:23S rRNA (uracil1939-C5)-methyltransferase